MATTKRRKTNAGGSRPGAGRKAEVGDLRGVLVYLDPASVETARKLGEENVSRGVREALRIAAEATANIPEPETED